MEINDDVQAICKTNSQVKFKTKTTKTNFCDNSNAYIPVKGTITINELEADEVRK